jgi:tetratricopeptide (TPR) repeat protein
MVLSFFSKGNDVAELIAKKKYARAIEVLDDQLREDAGNPRLRMQLADVLVMAGQPQEAVPVLMELADYYGAERQAAKAIATLKKIQRIAPGRRDVETRLASLIKGKSKPAAWTPREGIGAEGYEAAGAVFGAEHFEQQAVVTDEERIAAAKQASWQPSLQAEEQAPAAIPVIPGLAESAPPPAPPRPEPVAELSQASFESHMLSAIQHALKTPMAPSPPPAAGDTQGAVAQSPLFSDFSEEELVAVIQGMELLIFEAGDIIISEGDPGDSLFVITTGTAKAFVRRDGKQTLAREMAEGTFFGEISILSGKPRTATVTAATPCELLELDRATLDEITKTHPNVQKVLEDFYIARASGTPDAG